MSTSVIAAHHMSAHGPLARTSTAPVFPTRSAAAGTGVIMSNSARSSQLSGSTAFTSSTTSLSSMNSSTTLVPPQKMAQNNGNVIATNNIINQRADASRSMYQVCVNLRLRLAQVPGFDVHLRNSLEDDERVMEGTQIDPVSSLWRCLRKGVPLITIWNCLQTSDPIVLDENVKEGKIPKFAAFKFLAACLKENGELHLAPAVCFSLSDLFGEDTSGFVKVTQVVNLVLDVAEQKGLLLTSDKADEEIMTDMPGQPKMTYRDHVVKELVDTERKYVQDLENLHDLKKKIETTGVVSGDVVHDIFLNINAILDFQRRFLIQIETTNSQPVDQQKWGAPFANHEIAFKIYEPFIANQRKAATIAKREYDKIALADHPVASDYNTLDGFLLKPMQRLVKYPLLLKDLRDKGNKQNTDEGTHLDLTAGIEASNRALMGANNAVDLDMRQEAYEDLKHRVDDWKNHRVDHFGTLLLYGHFPVVTGKSDVQKEVRSLFTRNRNDPSQNMMVPVIWSLRNSWEAKCKALLSDSTPQTGAQWDMQSALQYHEFFSDQRHKTEPTLDNFFNGMDGFFKEFADHCPSSEQYTIYLFERILLCCKDLNPSKSKDKLLGGQKDKKDKKDKIRKEPNKNAKLQLKGRIFMTNVTDVASLAKQGSYTVQIFWKGDPGVENFIIRFSNEELMRKWYEGVDSQRRLHSSAQGTGSSPDALPANFTWMQEQGAPMLNPYAQQEDDEEDEDYATAQSMVAQATMPNSTYPGPVSSMPQNSSSVSLRSRSTTGSSQDSIATVVRAQPPRFPTGLTMPPLSLQTSMTGQLPSPSQRGGDSYFSPVAESPASSRASTSNGMYPFPRQTTPNGGWEETTRYDQNRNTAPAGPRAPSRGSQSTIDGYQMTGRAAQRPSLPAQPSSQRSRSHSTPDANVPGARRLPNGSLSGQPVPAVPGIPAHLAYDSGIPRSANNSPSGVPTRTSTQSPGMQRERQVQQAQYPSAPIYARNNTSQIPTMSSFDNRTISSENGPPLPTQLKVKVSCDGNYVTLVVAFNITYQSLVDRIDAKVGRFSTSTIAQGTLRLKYRDEDGDDVTVESDDDIQIAFQEWREAQGQQYLQGQQLGEIELFCHSTDN